MKILVFANTEREAKQAASKYMVDKNAVGYRNANDFDPKNLEKCDKAVVIGNFPEIKKAYEKKDEPLSKPSADRTKSNKR
jgi:hypothetical protein